MFANEVPNRNTKALNERTSNYVKEWSIIVTDKWKAFNGFDENMSIM